MKSIQFPDMFSQTVTNIVNDDYEATLQNLKLLLLTEENELFGDPYFGTGLLKYIYEQNDAVLKDICIDAIYTKVAAFMPQIKIERSGINIEIEGTKLIVNIQALNRKNFVTNLYSIVLLENTNNV